jgi:hypothetical protein
MRPAVARLPRLMTCPGRVMPCKGTGMGPVVVVPDRGNSSAARSGDISGRLEEPQLTLGEGL